MPEQEHIHAETGATWLIWLSLIPGVLALYLGWRGMCQPGAWGWWAAAAYCAVQWATFLWLGHVVAAAPEYPGKEDL